MTRFLILAFLIAATAAPVAAQQSSSSLLSAAARQEMEEKIRRLQAEVEDMKALNNSLNESLNTLTRQVKAQNDAMKKFADAYKIALSDYARKDDIEAVAKSAREIERNRKADQAQVLKKFQELRQLILDNPPKVIHIPASPRNDAKGRPSRSDEPKGAEHEVGKGQTLTAIIAAFNDQLKRDGRKARVTLSQVKAANPGVNIDRLVVGQKIFIPIVD